MRILTALPYYAPEGGGLERYAHETLKRLVARGHEVVAIAATRGVAGEGALDGVVVKRGRPRAFVSNTPLRPGLPLALARAARGADVILAHGPVPGPIEAAGLASLASGRPLVVTYHAGRLTSDATVGRWLAAVDAGTLERFALARAARLVAVSEFVRDVKLRRHRGKTVVIPPGVDAERFAPSPDPSAPAVFFAGPLTEAYRWKGADVVLEAVARLPEAELWIVGEGPRAGELRALAEGLGVSGRIRFLGRLPEEALPRVLARARVAALPSLTDAESFGMLAAEANACGVPVVASRVGGLPAIVRDGENGLLVPPGDVRALADALSIFLASPGKAREMGLAGRARVAHENRWADAALALERVLTEACELAP